MKVTPLNCHRVFAHLPSRFTVASSSTAVPLAARVLDMSVGQDAPLSHRKVYVGVSLRKAVASNGTAPAAAEALAASIDERLLQRRAAS